MNKKLKLEELNRVSVEEFKSQSKPAIIGILDNVRSMNNVGSIFRTADAFSIEKLYLCGITPTPPHREIQKTALGATDSVDWEYEKNIIDVIKKLKSLGYTILGIEQATNSINLNEFKIEKNEKYAIILGNEVDGINDDVINELDYCIEIPQFGTKHSLNVSVCGGIIFWEFSKFLILK